MNMEQIVDAGVRYVCSIKPRRPRIRCLLRRLSATNFRQLLDVEDGLSDAQLRAADAWAADLDAAANAAVLTLSEILGEEHSVRDVEKLVAVACAARYARLQAWSPAATENAMSMYSLFVFGRKSFGRFVCCDRHLPMRTEVGMLSAVSDLVFFGELDLELRALLVREIRPRIQAAKDELQSYIRSRAERARAVAETKRAREIIDGVPRRGPGRPRKQTNPTNQTEMEMP